MFDIFKRWRKNDGTQRSTEDVTVSSNADIEVNVGTADELAADPSVPFDPGHLSVWTISTSSSQAEAKSGVSAGTATPSAPRSQPAPDPGTAERGTFIFPNDQNFMEKIAARGVNGHGELVETVYVLAGPTYTVPTELFRLDNPEYFVSATATSVRSKIGDMAEKIASLYPDGEAPKLLARFHTHPRGSTTPSSTDRSGAIRVRDTFVDAFETDDFEFFQGIHALKPHGSSPKASERYSLESTAGGVSWRGERFRHELALYGPRFNNPRKVVIHDGA